MGTILSILPLKIDYMLREFSNHRTGSQLLLTEQQSTLTHKGYGPGKDLLLTILWNKGTDREIVIDGVTHIFPHNTILPLVGANTFEITPAADIIAWQFNREFYCVVDHDKEVSCVGFIFYGAKGHLFIELDEKNNAKLQALAQVFADEYDEENEIKEEMLRMLLKRLIILVTRLGKQQYLATDIDQSEEGIIRDFNLLLEQNFRKLHQVQDYADLLHKSPKTLSNVFNKYNSKSPVQVIKERIVLEAKRLLFYTDKTAKEIGYELGFEEPATFSRFFKNATKTSPSAFKKMATTF